MSNGIDVELDFDDAGALTDFPVAAEGDYEFQIAAVPEKRESGDQAKIPGRSYFAWQLEIINAEEADNNGIKIFNVTMLPYDHNGEIITTGVKMLHDFCVAIDKPWEGAPATYIEEHANEYVGLTGRMKVSIKPNRDTGEPQNQVKKFYA